MRKLEFYSLESKEDFEKNLKKLIRKIVCLGFPYNFNVTDCKHFIYFGEIEDEEKEKHEFLQQNADYKVRPYGTTDKINSLLVPEEGISFNGLEIEVDVKADGFVDRTYSPNDEGYAERLNAFQENKLWVPSQRVVKA